RWRAASRTPRSAAPETSRRRGCAWREPIRSARRDGARTGETVDFLVAVAELVEYLVGVLADRRRLAEARGDRQLAVVERRRARHLPLHLSGRVGVRHVDEAAGGMRLGILHQLGRGLDGLPAHAAGFEPGGDLVVAEAG